MTQQPNKMDAEALGSQVEWIDFVTELNWGPGNRDQSAYTAFLRAGTLRMPEQYALQKVKELIVANGGTYSQSKIVSQLRRAYNFVGTAASQAIAIHKEERLTFQPEKVDQLVKGMPPITRQWLQQRSPMPCAGMTSTEALNHLYTAGEKVVVFTDVQSQGQAIFVSGVTPASEIPTDGTDGVWFLVNPVDGESHPNPRQENRLSRRSEESVTSWRYLVLESDVMPEEQWLQVLARIPMRISAIYASGGKSIHALVRVDATSKEEWDQMRVRIKRILVPLGADLQAMTAVRLSRLPNATRGPNLQELLYLNPEPKPEPIFKRE